MNNLQPECDFCNETLEEGEELEPVFIGSPPEPQPIRAKEIVDKPSSTLHILGHSAGEIKALDSVLRAVDEVEFETFRRVQETEPMMVEDPSDLDPTKHTSEINEDKAAAELTINARFEEPEPDMSVCEFCAKSFTGENDD